MRYKVLIETKAKKEIERLDLSGQRKVAKGIEGLEENPTPPTKNFRPLRGYNLYRLRVGDLGIIYSIDQAKRLVIIEKIGKRDEKFYKLLRR